MQKRITEQTVDQHIVERSAATGERCRLAFDRGRRQRTQRDRLGRNERLGTGEQAIPATPGVADQQRVRGLGHCRQANQQSMAVERTHFTDRQRLPPAKQRHLPAGPGGRHVERRRRAEHGQTLQIERVHGRLCQPGVPDPGALPRTLPGAGPFGRGGAGHVPNAGIQGTQLVIKRNRLGCRRQCQHVLRCENLTEAGKNLPSRNPPYHAGAVDQQWS